jgi:hypothetical protein
MSRGSRQSPSRSHSGNGSPKITSPPVEDPESSADSGEDQEYSIKDIIDEEVRNGVVVRYKIDWEPDEVTGETYKPTWVRRCPSQSKPTTQTLTSGIATGRKRQPASYRRVGTH